MEVVDLYLFLSYDDMLCYVLYAHPAFGCIMMTRGWDSGTYQLFACLAMFFLGGVSC
jgi:hypothetical protein